MKTSRREEEENEKEIGFVHNKRLRTTERTQAIDKPVYVGERAKREFQQNRTINNNVHVGQV